MLLITLTNDFHRTETRVRPDEDGTVSRSVERRAWRDLCGMTDCECGGPGGVRGGDARLEGQGDRYRVMQRVWLDEYGVWDHVPLVHVGASS